MFKQKSTENVKLYTKSSNEQVTKNNYSGTHRLALMWTLLPMYMCFQIQNKRCFKCLVFFLLTLNTCNLNYT